MFEQRRKRQQIRRKIALIEGEYSRLWAKVQEAAKVNDEEKREDAHLESLRKIQILEHAKTMLQQFESRVVMNKARRLSLEIPSAKEKPTWWENDYQPGMPEEAVTDWLSETGRIAVSKMIKIERRADFEWWFTKIVLPALQALVPIMALILGLVSVAKN